MLLPIKSQDIFMEYVMYYEVQPFVVAAASLLQVKTRPVHCYS